jgi:hypothetical protein
MFQKLDLFLSLSVIWNHENPLDSKCNLIFALHVVNELDISIKAYITYTINPFQDFPAGF